MPTSARPRVLVLGTTLPAEVDDGTPQFVLDLAQGVAAVADVTIVAPRVPGGARRETMLGVDVVRVPYFPRRWEHLADGAILPNIRRQPLLALQAPFLFLSLLLGGLRALRRGSFDVVHAHWAIPAGVVAAVLRRLTGTPFVLTVHGADGFALRGRLMTRVKAWVCDTASAIGAVSTDLAHALPRTDTPVDVVPMGVDIAGLQRGVGERRPQAGRVLFVGRLARKKGVPVLVRAAGRVDGLQVVVGGHGPDEQELRRLADEVGQGRTTFLGRLTRHEVKHELALAQVLVLPSMVADDGDQDGTPVVLSEAMAAGVPVVASDLGGLGEQVRDGKTGLLVEPGSVDDLARALAWVRDHPDEVEAMGLRAREWIVGSPLDVASTAREYERLFRRALGMPATVPTEGR